MQVTTSSKQRWLLIVTVLVMWCWRGVVPQSVPDDCIDPDLVLCTSAYTDSLHGNVITRKDKYCKVLRKYHSCVADLCDKFPKDVIDFIVDAQTQYGFDCGITAASVRCLPPSLLFLLVSSTIFPTFVLL